jgi:hypothetical protein
MSIKTKCKTGYVHSSETESAVFAKAKTEAPAVRCMSPEVKTPTA